jgi:hypothetical protein
MHYQPNCARTLRRAHDLVSFFAVIPERVRWGRQSTRFGRRGFVFYPLFFRVQQRISGLSLVAGVWGL